MSANDITNATVATVSKYEVGFYVTDTDEWSEMSQWRYSKHQDSAWPITFIDQKYLLYKLYITFHLLLKEIFN